jgi:hypothetical protein
MPAPSFVQAVLATLLLLMALPTLAQDLSGCYRSRALHPPSSPPAAPPAFVSGESLVLRQHSQSEIEFHFTTTSHDGNFCAAHGLARRVVKGNTTKFEFTRKQGEDAGSGLYPSPPCKIHLTVARGSLQLTSVAGNCDSYFLCGFNAHIDGKFSRSTRTELGTHGCKMPAP